MKTNSIDVVEHISKAEFDENYLRPQKPLILRGLTKECAAGEKWTIDYIREVCGEVMVDVFDNSNPNSETAFTTPDLKMRFADYVDTVVADKPSPLRMFLFNMFKCKPQLRKDFPCPPMFKGILGRIGFMFFGSKGIKVRIHQDMDMSNVMLTQFYGRKKVVLIAPAYSKLLYRLPLNTHSLVDLDNPDYVKYPGLRYVEMQECILEPGDTLFMPSGYWHYITYLDGGFAVSYRKIAQSAKAKLVGFLNICVYMPVDKLLNKIFGLKWLVRKERMAAMRADREIQRLRQNPDWEKKLRGGVLHPAPQQAH